MSGELDIILFRHMPINGNVNDICHGNKTSQTLNKRDNWHEIPYVIVVLSSSIAIEILLLLIAQLLMYLSISTLAVDHSQSLSSISLSYSIYPAIQQKFGAQL